MRERAARATTEAPPAATPRPIPSARALRRSGQRAPGRREAAIVRGRGSTSRRARGKRMRKLLASAKAGLSCRAENGLILSSSKNWDRRVADAELLARSAGFRDLRDRIVALARPRAGDVVVDLGLGTGLLSLAFASRSSRVWAIDSSAAMNEYLDAKAASAGLTNLETVRASVISLPLVEGTADLVVSNYCLHELGDRDKELALTEAMRVLKPGGRLLIADMMFSLNPLAARDRRVITD